MVGGHDRDRLAGVAHLVDGQHRLVGDLKPVVLLPGTSSCVRTAVTPAVASASPMSMLRIRARGCGLRSVTPQSMSSSQRSEEYAKSPVTFGRPSGRSGDCADAAGSGVLGRRSCAASWSYRGPRAAARRTASMIFS